MSIIRDSFPSLYRSGAWFTEAFLPKAFGKLGVSHGKAAGALAGCVAGVASIVVGSCFLAALPMSLPMFSVGVTIYGAKGLAMAAGLGAALVGTGTVVTVTGLGMCRDMANRTLRGAAKAQGPKAAASHAPSPAENSAFVKRMKAAACFRKAAKATETALKAAEPKGPLPPVPFIHQ